MDSNAHWQVIPDLVWGNVQSRRNTLKPLVAGFSARVLFEYEVLSVLVVKTSFIHSNKDIVDPQKVAE